NEVRLATTFILRFIASLRLFIACTLLLQFHFVFAMLLFFRSLMSHLGSRISL
ncbi:hypothetical protein SK128_022933, partial [Halocaridina rubra]